MGGSQNVHLDIERLTFGYRSSRALALDVDTSFGSGKTIVLGPNGAGKTTLFSLCANRLRVGSGSISLALEERILPSSTRAYRASVGYMPQSPNFVPGLSAIDQLRYAAWLAGLDGKEISKAATDWIERVNLAEHAHKRCGELSGGMQRRLAFAAASVNTPALLLLDEPTAGLDPLERSSFRQVLTALSHESVVLVSTHQIDDLDLVADRIAVLSAGRFVFQGHLSEFLQLGDQTLPQLKQAESAYSAAILRGNVT